VDTSERRGCDVLAERVGALGPQGCMIRPGAPFFPVSVWQLLQSPVDCAAPIARSLPFMRTFARIGNTMVAVLERRRKFPYAFTGSVNSVLFASVMMTCMPEAVPFDP
jgi:hypothetical protein